MTSCGAYNTCEKPVKFTPHAIHGYEGRSRAWELNSSGRPCSFFCASRRKNSGTDFCDCTRFTLRQSPFAYPCFVHIVHVHKMYQNNLAIWVLRAQMAMRRKIIDPCVFVHSVRAGVLDCTVAHWTTISCIEEEVRLQIGGNGKNDVFSLFCHV